MNWLLKRKHSCLLLILLVALVAQPLLGGSAELLAYVIMLAVFLAILDRRWERSVGLAIGIPAMLVNASTFLLPGSYADAADIIYHALMVVFLTLAVVAILRRVFEHPQIEFDHVVGAFCGFVLAGIGFGNLFLLIEKLAPGSFDVNREIAWQLQDERTRRFLFNHLSFVTLTTLGYGDITPITPLACAFTWMEAMFGQFYVAVYIGQLIGMKLAGGQPRPAGEPIAKNEP